MNMRTRYLMLLPCLMALLCGCGGTEYAYRDGRDQKEGPGLLSGKDGVFTIYNKGSENSEKESPQGKAEKKQTGQ
jgi:hypothetical protein